MAVIPQKWRDYARLQSKLLKNTVVDDQSWGVEAGLNVMLAENDNTINQCTAHINRVARSAARLERYRARSRRIFLAPFAQDTVDQENQLSARSELKAIRTRVSLNDWSTLTKLAAGEDYASIAADAGTSKASLRTMVCRMRKKAAAHKFRV
jgi:hypothetical protein